MKRTPLKRKTPLRTKTPLKTKKAMPKKAKYKKRGWYTKKLDDIAKGFAKERDNYICQYLGTPVEGSNAHGSHVVPVSAGNNLRWDLNNIKCLSYHYHLNWWHKNPLEAQEWFKENFPDRFKYITDHRNDDFHKTLKELADFHDSAKKASTPQEYQNIYLTWRNN